MSSPDLVPLIDLADSANHHYRPADYLMARPKISTLTAGLGEALRAESQLRPELLELATLLVAVRRRSQFGVIVSRRLATAAGIDPTVTNALIAGGRVELVDPAQAMIVRIVDSLLATGRIPRTLLTEAEKLLGHAALADLVAIVGYQSMMAMALSAYRD